ncbi:hypothetical protein DLO84_18185 [Salmonella enterica]|uniref:Uncharacterized protein n=8 Tax=Salmonella enterica I TaxID=59201 RepID=A0A5I4YEN1_SALET|nr:hypothetical protein [Salmonella enterica subsp. enterica serovar Chester]EAA7309633.1 hypothetical protein [Salmonella enterica subsp. enterica serovar Duesseldorf]EAA7660203.1 hypothetical protein [Salmonella enterica subsp. enterica serovar Havana]EAA8323606.1 hypothetical protein [Salmonella enterica subsp. enterica]EAM1749814.1 hypothetical protein [Salmonella enterica]EBQ8980583.1 hypothetical protein [Salmonella enterica subsp. enterica serovar Albany]EBS4137377.1 hypothetical prote
MVLLNSLPCNYLSLVDVLSYSGERMVMADDSRFFIMLACVDNTLSRHRSGCPHIIRRMVYV